MPTRTLHSTVFFFVVILGIFSSGSRAAARDIPSLSLSVDYAVSQQDEGTVVAAVWLTPPSGYYTYAHDDAGAMPTRLVVRDSRGEALPLTVLYPQGTARRDKLDPSRRVLAYETRLPIFVRVPAKTRAKGPLTAHLSLLLCSSRNCMPVRDEVLLVPPQAPPALATVSWAGAYREALTRSGRERPQPPDGPDQVDRAEAQTVLPRQGEATEVDSFPAAPAEPLNGVAVSAGAVASPSVAPVPDQGGTPFPGRRFVPRFFQAGLEPPALGMALLLGLAAGLLLNVMPCVLPVLTMKLSGLLAVSGHENRAGQRARLREHALLFAAGVITWFAVLAVCVGGLGVAWGGLFQNSGLVYGLLILVFLLALSMFEVFTLPILDFKVSSSGNPKVQAYATGLVATLLATPCSGPLLGGVLGWAVLQPLPVILAVFLATGLGMALPHLLLALWPGAVRLLPRPGPWMGVMERLVGFFLLGTALYLLTILPAALRQSALVVLLITALAAWIWGRWGGLAASAAQRGVAGGLAVLMTAGAIWWSVQPPPEPVTWTPFSAGTFRALVGKEPLLVEFTADWCPSCKVLERTALTPRRLRPLVERYGLRLIKVDLTRPDPDGEALLRAMGSVSIPVAAIFPKGLLAGSPLVLRDLYTPGQLAEAVATLSPVPAGKEH